MCLLTKESSIDALAYLMDLGLTRLQTETYLCLASLGRARPSRLAKSLGIVRPEIYRILSDLLEKRLVERLLTRPAIYEVCDPEHGLRAMITRLCDRAQRAVDQFDKINSFIKSGIPLTEPTESEFKLLPGRDLVIDTAVGMMHRSRSRYDAIYSKWGIGRFTKNSPTRKAIASASRRGVRIRIVSEVDKSNRRQALAMKKHAQVRRASEITFYMEICDGTEVTFGPSLTETDTLNSRQQVDLWTNNIPFVKACEGMFERVWDGSSEL